LAENLDHNNHCVFYLMMSVIFHDPDTEELVHLSANYQTWPGSDTCCAHLMVVRVFNPRSTFGAPTLMVIGAASGASMVML
jgi:hypothetical protein